MIPTPIIVATHRVFLLAAQPSSAAMKDTQCVPEVAFCKKCSGVSTPFKGILFLSSFCSPGGEEQLFGVVLNQIG